MLKVGDEVEGYCSRCKLNVYMNIAATDGREIFKTTCRTCHETVKYQPERSQEQIKAENWKKLMRQKRNKSPRRMPEIVSRRRRGELVNESPEQPTKTTKRVSTDAQSEGVKESSLPKHTAGVTWGKPRKSIALEDSAEKPSTNPTEQWRKLTAALGPRDGRPYYPNDTYREGDVLLHKRHGMGIVESILHEKACMVLFRSARQVIEMGQSTTV